MPIPTPQDADLAEISNLANSVMVRLMVLRHAGGGKRDFAGLREVLQDYIDRVMAFAHATER